MSVSLIRADTGESLALPGASVVRVSERGQFTRFPISGELSSDHYRDEGAYADITATVAAEDVEDVLGRLQSMRGQTSVSLAQEGQPLVERLGVEGFDRVSGMTDGIELSISLTEVQVGTTLTIRRAQVPRGEVAAGQATETNKGNRPATKDTGRPSLLKSGANTLSGLFDGGT